MIRFQRRIPLIKVPAKRVTQRQFTGFTIFVAAVIVFILLAPELTPYDPFATVLSDRFQPPGSEGHLLGTDNLGRDILSRIMAGGRSSLLAGFSVTGIVFATGTILGVLAGYFGGVTDAVISKITTTFQAFPSFVLAIAIAGILGPGIGKAVLALALVYWTTYQRLARSMTISVRHREFVSSAKLCGAGRAAIIGKYIIPEILPQMIITAMLDIGNVILSLAALSFIGLGTVRPSAEWGAMMSESRSYLQQASWTIVIPGIAIFFLVIVFNLYGDIVRNRIKDA